MLLSSSLLNKINFFVYFIRMSKPLLSNDLLTLLKKANKGSGKFGIINQLLISL